jgi:hypothetical protein
VDGCAGYHTDLVRGAIQLRRELFQHHCEPNSGLECSELVSNAPPVVHCMFLMRSDRDVSYGESMIAHRGPVN